MTVHDELTKIRQEIESCEAQINVNKGKVKRLRERNRDFRAKIKELKDKRVKLIFSTIANGERKDEE